jgi:hypothetical protein
VSEKDTANITEERFAVGNVAKWDLMYSWQERGAFRMT